MLVMFIGDQAIFVGSCVKGGWEFVVMWKFYYKKHYLRRELNRKLPPIRLTIQGDYCNGEEYGYRNGGNSNP